MITAIAALTLVRDYAKEPGVNQSMVSTMIEDMIQQIEITDLKHNIDLVIMDDFSEVEHLKIRPTNRMIMYCNRHLSMVRIFSNYNVHYVYITQRAIDKNDDIQLILTKLKLDGKDYQTIG